MQGKQYRYIDKQVYETPNDQPITDIPRSKEERKQRLQALVFHFLEKRWMQIPKARATLEKQGIKELIDSL